MKYPRTYHLPFSNVEKDSKLGDYSNLIGKEVIVSEKMDGENTGIDRVLCHARSLDSNNHPSRNWVKGFAAQFQYKMPENLKFFGENLYAKHSIFYDDLANYFLGFAALRDKIFLSWDETIFLFNEYQIKPVKVLYRGKFDLNLLKEVYNSLNYERSEGIVVRSAYSYSYEDHELNVFKAVRKDHVKSDKHWTLNWERNKLL